MAQDNKPTPPASAPTDSKAKKPASAPTDRHFLVTADCYRPELGLYDTYIKANTLIHVSAQTIAQLEARRTEDDKPINWVSATWTETDADGVPLPGGQKAKAIGRSLNLRGKKDPLKSLVEQDDDE